MATAMQEIKEQAEYGPEDFSLLQALEVFCALESIVADSSQPEFDFIQVHIPGLRNQENGFPPNNKPGKNQNQSDFIVERQQQLDSILLGMSSLNRIMQSIGSFQQALNKDCVIKSLNSLYRARASALWRIPVEVLSEIFMYCLPTDINKLSPAYSRTAPVLLTQVCRRWREVSLDLPSLWSRVCLQGNYDKGYCHKWLERTRDYPLSLCLDDFWSGENSLEPYFHRIVSLETNQDSVAGYFIDFLTSIQELTISTDLRRIDMEEFAESLLDRSSTLRSLRFTRHGSGAFNSRRYSHHFDLVWPHLTNLEIDADESWFRPLLELGRNLSSFKLTIRTSFINVEKIGDESITHTKLRTLRISAFGYSELPSPIPIVFHVLTLPNLRVLEVSCKPRDTYMSHEIFKQFLTRSNCPLRSLTFGSGMMVTDEEIAEYHALVPSLLEVVRGEGCLGGELTHSV